MVMFTARDSSSPSQRLPPPPHATHTTFPGLSPSNYCGVCSGKAEDLSARLWDSAECLERWMTSAFLITNVVYKQEALDCFWFHCGFYL